MSVTIDRILGVFSISELGSLFLCFLVDRIFFIKKCRTTKDDFPVQVAETWRWKSGFEFQTV